MRKRGCACVAAHRARHACGAVVKRLDAAAPFVGAHARIRSLC